jgi:hypothetical protein
MGVSLQDQEFSASILASLPDTYCKYMSGIIASVEATGQTLHPDAIVWIVLEEVTRKEILACETKSKAREVALLTKEQKSKPSKFSLKCSNPKCGRMGHTIEDCYAEGGGKEGQAPWQKKAKENQKEDQKESAKVAAEKGKDPSEKCEFAFTCTFGNLETIMKIVDKARDSPAIVDNGATATSA